MSVENASAVEKIAVENAATAEKITAENKAAAWTASVENDSNKFAAERKKRYAGNRIADMGILSAFVEADVENA